jgi:hypothetical protein
MFLKELKCYLRSGEFVVLCVFAENYSFVSQDEAQVFHWNNAQATIHPFVIYFKKSGALNTGCVLSVSEESNDVKISSLHPHGPSASYIYPAMSHILRLHQATILAKVSPKPATGHNIHFNQ